MPRISASVFLLEKDMVELVTRLIREQPEVESLFSCVCSQNELDVRAVIDSFSRDAIALLRAIDGSHEDDSQRFVDAVEYQLSTLTLPSEQSYRPKDRQSGHVSRTFDILTQLPEAQNTRKESTWTHYETRTSEMPGGIIFRVDSFTSLSFTTAVCALLAKGAMAFNSQSIQSTDDCIGALAQLTCSYLGVELTSPNALLLILVCCGFFTIKERDKLFGTIGSDCICTYHKANMLSVQDADSKVTVTDIVASFPQGEVEGLLGACPKDNGRTMPRCRFRNSDHACTMRHPCRRPNREDTEPAEDKVKRVMDSLVDKGVFMHDASWSDEFYFRRGLTKVITVSI